MTRSSRQSCRYGEGSVFSRVAYIPTFCSAGKLNQAFHLSARLRAAAEHQLTRKRQLLELELHTELNADFEMHEAVVEFIELTTWLLGGLLGPRHTNSLTKLAAILAGCVHSGVVLDVITPTALPSLSAAVVSLAQSFAALRLDPPRGGGGQSPHKPPKLGADVNGIIDKLRTTLDALKACFGRRAKEIHVELETLKFSSSGFFWDDAYARATIAALRLQPQCADKCDGTLANPHRQPHSCAPHHTIKYCAPGF